MGPNARIVVVFLFRRERLLALRAGWTRSSVWRWFLLPVRAWPAPRAAPTQGDQGSTDRCPLPFAFISFEQTAHPRCRPAADRCHQYRHIVSSISTSALHPPAHRTCVFGLHVAGFLCGVATVASATDSGKVGDEYPRYGVCMSAFCLFDVQRVDQPDLVARCCVFPLLKNPQDICPPPPEKGAGSRATSYV